MRYGDPFFPDVCTYVYIHLVDERNQGLEIQQAFKEGVDTDDAVDARLERIMFGKEQGAFHGDVSRPSEANDDDIIAGLQHAVYRLIDRLGERPVMPLVFKKVRLS
ncbi:MAG: hypothetical protein HY073_00185 [Deltaproteobacteria bacterium]|nr:hypothetical protein [Deltaproteobacteria bacterium]